MKRKLLSLVVILFVFSAGVVTAGSINGTYNGNPIVKLFVGAKELKPTDVPAQIVDGRTMVPIYMLQELGVKLEWDPQTYRVNVEMPTRTVSVLTQGQLEELSGAVYKVLASTNNPNVWNQGSGFIVNGKLITNYHVAGGSKTVRALIDGFWQTLPPPSFADEEADLIGFHALFGKELPTSTELPQIGDPVYAIGFGGGTLDITEGKIINIFDPDGNMEIAHTAKTEHGDSGGVLLSGDGKIIGVNSSGTEYISTAKGIKNVFERLDNQ